MNWNIGMSFLNRRGWLLCLSLALSTLFLAQRVHAQGYGSIQGAVVDATGAAVNNAQVTVTELKTGKAVSNPVNDRGQYIFPSLPPAEYSVSVAAPGFQRYVQNGLVLQADQAATANIILHVGEASQAVTVSADAQQVDTTTGTLSEVIDAQRVNDLPLNGRNAAQLTTLVAGVVSAPNDGADQGQTKSFPVVVTVSANGSRSNQTDYILDGGNNVDEYTNVNQPFPFPDALQEFSVQTSNYNAEYGQNAGAVVNIVTKSGGNSFHGDAFEYLRNGVFNARNYFASTVDPLKRNQFGGTIGGPVKIPHLVSGNHTFFFFGVQKTTLSDSQGGQNAYIPTQANLAGDFSALNSATNPNNPLQKAIQVDDPTGKPYSGNIIPTTQFDPAALAVEAHLPKATGNGQVFYSVPVHQSYLEYIGRLDQDLGKKDHLFGHYYNNDFVNAGSLDLTNLLTYSDHVDIRVQSALLSDTHTFNSNWVNSLVVNYSREIANRGPLPGAPSVGDFGVNMYLPPQKSIQSISTTGFFKFGDNPLAAFARNNYTASDDVHWVHGNHNIAFGAHAEISKIDINSLFNEPGSFTFNANTTNYAAASFLLGFMYQFAQGSGQYYNDRNHFYGFYAQDSWKATRRLTLNYGVRYEPYMPWHEKEGRIEQFDPAGFAAKRISTVYPGAPAGLYFRGDPGMPEDGVNSAYDHFMPRVGFALDVFGDGKTSLRGGSGVFFNTREPAASNVPVTNVTPFSVSVSLTNPQGRFSNPYAGTTDPFPQPSPAPHNVVFPSPVTVYTYNPSGQYHVSVTYDWNLTIEQELTPSMRLRMAYVGSHASHMSTDWELNPATYIPGSTIGTDQRRRYLGYSTISLYDMGGNFSYHSGQVSLDKRLSRGLSVLASYTFSKSLDSLPYSTSANAGNSNQSYVYPIYQQNFRALDYGPSDFDIRHVLSISYVYELPHLRSGASFIKAIVNGWSTTGVLQLHSGMPLTVLAGSDVSGTGLMQDRAVQLISQPYGSGACTNPAKACKSWLNPSAFALPAPGGFGNVQKDSLRGPSYGDWDAGLIRYFPVYREAKLQFRAEYFDLLNSPNFANPVNTVTGAGFGSIGTANTSRLAQLSLKLAF